jgi:transposase
MGKVKDILRLRAAGLSQRETAAATGCSLGTVNAVLTRLKEAGITEPLKHKERDLGTIIFPAGKKTPGERPEPDLEYICREMRRPGVTLTVLWEEYKEAHPEGIQYSQFCDRYYRFRKQNDVYFVKTYKAGDQMMVDWAGMTMGYTDRGGEEHKAYLFVAVLPASSIIYAEPFRDMGQESWTEAHINAFEYFGGVPRLLVPDNAKTAVVKVKRHESELNRSYEEMARYYGTAVVPARPRSPKDKAPVETAVQITERRIIARLRDRQFKSFSELHQAVREALEELNGQPFQKLPGNRRQAFLETERGALKPLPPSRYEYARFRLAKVNFNYHVQYEQFYYSVPWQYAGKQVEIRAKSRTIEVFADIRSGASERIAIHLRSYDNSRRYTTDFNHMPKRHQAMAEWTPERFRSWAAKTGPSTEAYIVWLMEKRDQPEQAFKTCMAILHLAKTVTAARMEDASSRAIEMNLYGFKYFERLLKNTMGSDHGPIEHENIRGSEYYQEADHA